MYKVAVAGSSGFVGSALLPKLAKEHSVLALTRGDIPNQKNINWVKCDLFSLLETERALEGVDFAVYLVHSMLPSAQLTQGKFQDLDLLVADNFARAAEKNKIKQIIYVGGIIPSNQELSRHLASRKEVENALSFRTAKLTTLRAGMIIGANGSSLNIVTRLVHKLPIMFCPSWTSKSSRPVDLDDVADSIIYLIGKKEHYSKTYDLAGEEKVTYKEMMLEVARQTGRSLKIHSLPFFTPGLSGLWVSLITGAPKNLIAPLISSLKNEMLPDKKMILEIPGKKFIGFSASLKKALSIDYKPKPRAFTLPESEKRKKTVRSVQRVFLPKNLTARKASEKYVNWLPIFLNPFLKVELIKDDCIFKVPFFNLTLLILRKSEQRSSENRQLYYIVGGLLVKPKTRGRIEFRTTYDNKSLIIAIHDYKPTLPWYVYRFTQAILHLWVMKNFDSYLRKESFS